MGQFSTTQNRGEYCIPCQSANLFAANFPAGGPTIEGMVGGESTQISLGGAVSPLKNTMEGTSGQFALKIDGQEKTIVDDLSKFNITRPQDVGAYFESQPASSVSSATPQEGEDVVIIAVEPLMKATAPVEGNVDIETADDATVAWLAITIATGLNIIDSTTGATQLSEETGGAVDFTLTGTNTVPLALELGDMLRRRENRQFLREIFKHKTKIGKIWTNSAGNLMVSFRGYAGLRTFLNNSKYLATNSKLAVITTAVKNSGNWAGTLKSVGGRIPLISYVIVGAIDVAEWLAQPESERDFSDLMATLFVDIAKIGIATIAGTLGAAAVIAGAVALGVSAPVWGVIAAGIGVAVAVGIALDWADNAFGITDRVMELADKVGANTVSFFEWVQDTYEKTAVAVGETVDKVVEPVTDTIDEAKKQINWFDNLNPMEQIDLLSKMFGGGGYRGGY